MLANSVCKAIKFGQIILDHARILKFVLSVMNFVLNSTTKCVSDNTYSPG